MQVSSTVPTPEQKTLFGLMSETLSLAKHLKQANIFLVGQTRSGKSTLFNWIVNNKLLIGSGQTVDPVYQVLSANASENRAELNQSSVHAQVKEGYKSVTLLPNIFHLSQSLGLVDLPGTRDQRSQIHVMMVSYIYNVFLKSSKRAKFVLVISNEGFNAPDSTKMVSLITMFIKLFRCNDMKDQQRQQLWKSVSLLVTSVPIEQGKQGQMKANYLRKLAKKLSFLKQLKIYQKIGQIFLYIQSMVNNIIQNKRLELFPKAKYGKVAQTSKVLRRFDSQGWKTCQLQSFSQFLKFPYAQQFLQLTTWQQQNLKRSIDRKVKDFKELQGYLSQLISKFLQNPVHNAYQSDEYQDIYKSLQEFYLQNLIQDANCIEKQKINLNLFADQTNSHNMGSIYVLKTVIKIYKISLDMDTLDSFIQSRNKVKKFNFLKDLFTKCLDWLISVYALTNKSKYVLQKIKDILCERFTHFMYISEIQDSFETVFIHALRDSIQVANQCSYQDYQVVGVFCKNANQEKELDQLMEIQHIQQFVQFLGKSQEKIQEKVQSLEIILKLSSKLYQLGAKKYSQEKQHTKSLNYNIQALTSLVSLKIFYKLQLQHNNQQDSPLIQNFNQVDDDLRAILVNLSIQILQQKQGKNFHQLQRLYRQSNMFCYILQIYQKYSTTYIKEPKFEVIFLQNYVKICQQEHQYKIAIQIYKRLIKKNYDKNKKNEYKAKIKNIQQKLSIKVERQKKQITLQSYLSIAQLVYTQILKIDKKVYKTEQIYAEIKEKLAKKLQTLQQGHQFTVELPQKLSNYDIIVYSRYLVSKISNRKTIILLGNKAGKSTASYWLRNKKLVQYNHQIDIENRQTAKINSIKHKVYEHTEVPNIHALNAQQLLVDAPHIYDNNPQKMLIIGHFLKEVIMKSSKTKFLLVIKQQDILTNDSAKLVQMLQYYIRIFDKFQENQNQKLQSCLALLITFFNRNNKGQVRKKFKQLGQLFSKDQNNDVIQQKFKLSKAVSPCSRQSIYMLLQYITRRGLVIQLDIENYYYQSKELMVHKIGQKQIFNNQINTLQSNNSQINALQSSGLSFWLFHDIQHSIRRKYCSFNPVWQFNANVQQSLCNRIDEKCKLAKNIIDFLTDTLIYVIQSDRDKEQLNSYLSQLQDKFSAKDMLAKTLPLKKLIKSLKYPEIQPLKIEHDPLVLLYKLFLTYRLLCIPVDYVNQGYQISYIKDYFKSVYSIYMEGVAGFFTNFHILEIAWLRIWQILVELQIIQIQSHIEQQIYYQAYGQHMSNVIMIKDKLRFLETSSKYRQIQSPFLLHFLIRIDQQMKLAKGFEFTFQILTTIRESPLYNKIFKGYKQKQSIEKDIASWLNKVQQCFIKNSPNDKQAAAVIVEQSLNYINPENSQLYFEQGQNTDKSLKFILEQNIHVLCQKLVTFDPKKAFQICDRFQDSSLKEKIFETMQKKQVLSDYYFQEFYEFLIKNGNNHRAYKLIDSWRQKGQLSKQQYQQKKRKIEKNENNRMSFLIKDMPLQDLKQIVKQFQPLFYQVEAAD